MLNETEIKVRISNPSEVIARCKQLWGHPKEVCQRDEYYDSENGGLRQQDLTLRLRSVNGVVSLALKSPRVYMTETIQTRIELEFKVAEPDAVRSQISNQGLIAMAVIEKNRLSFRSQFLAVEVDHLPYIGYFLEVEGQSIEEIEAALAEIGLDPSAAVRENYTELLERRLEELGKSVDRLEATFDREAADLGLSH